MKEIKLTQEKVAKVSDEDYEWLSKYTWFFDRYAYRQTSVKKKRKSHRMHRDIAEKMFGELPEGITVDHINHDKLDNRRENLRLATMAENVANLPLRIGKRFKGPSPDRRYGGWDSFIGFRYKRINLGRFETEEEAALAYNVAAKELFGEYARLNEVEGVTLCEEVERKVAEKATKSASSILAEASV